MNDKKSPNDIFFVAVPIESEQAESMILFNTLRGQFAKIGITFKGDDITKALGIMKTNSDEFIAHIDKKIIKRVEDLMKKLQGADNLYYCYYSTFCEYFAEFPPKDKNEVYKIIVTTFLSAMGLMLATDMGKQMGIIGMKSGGVIDNTAQMIIKAALDTQKSES